MIVIAAGTEALHSASLLALIYAKPQLSFVKKVLESLHDRIRSVFEDGSRYEAKIG